MTVKMCTPLFMFISKFHSSKHLALTIQRKNYKNVIFQSSFMSTNNFTNYDSQNPLKRILDTVPPESEALSPNDTLNIFRNLRETLKKLPKYPNSSCNVIDHQNFAILRQAMIVSVSYLRPNEKLDVLNAIQTLSVPVEDDVFNAVLSSLLENVYNMSLNDVMILDQVLITRRKNRLAMELHRNLIHRFNTKTSQHPIDFSYFMKTRRMLQFIERNRDEIIDEVFVNISKCAAKQPIDIMTAYEAMDVIITLSSFGNQCEYFKPVLNKAFDVWCTTEITLQMAEIVLTLLIRRKSYLNYDLYKDPRLIETCAQITIANGDVEKCFSMLRQLNRLEFTSKRLIDFLLEYMKEEKNQTHFVENCITMCIACDIGNHRPPLFEDFIFPLLAKMNFHQQLDIKLNWPKFAWRLHRLGVFHKALINEILKQKSHFESVDAACYAELEALQMENLVNANIRPLMQVLKQNIDENYFRCVVFAENGVIIPMLVKIDIHSKEFVAFGDDESNSLNSIRCNENQCLVAIVRSSAQDVHPFRSDICTILLNSAEWIDLLKHQTEQTLFADIHDRVQSQQLNQTNLNN